MISGLTERRSSIPTGHANGLWALETGRLSYDAGVVVLGATGLVDAPVPSFLIEHDRGLVLFDTGLDPAAADDPTAVYGPVADAFGMDFLHRDRVDVQIAAYGFDPADVTHVVVSHAHLDHTGGLKLFPRAKFFIGESDLRYVFWPHAATRDVCRWIDLERTKSFEWLPQQSDHDLFGDGSIVMLSMPGHTPGNSSLLVRLEHETIILSGDTVHLRVGLEGELPMGGDHDTNQSVRSIRRLKSLSASLDAKVWVGHDPGDLQNFGGYGRFTGA